MSKSILSITQECFDYLLTYKAKHADFYFVPRRKNNVNRLEQGYYFIGNEDYLQISFWLGSDSQEKIHNISLVIDRAENCYIEISSRDNANKAKYLAQLVDILSEKTGKKYEQVKLNKWNVYYPKSSFYLNVLYDFIQREKPIIDEFIKNTPNIEIELLDEEFHKKYVEKLIGNNWQDINKENKLEGEIAISPSKYIKTLRHNKIQNALINFLKMDSTNLKVELEKRYVDITVTKASKEVIFYEIKTSDVKHAIREGLGQLLEYNHYPNELHCKEMVIITEYEASEKDKIYLQFLRDTYGLSIYYQQFDFKSNKLLTRV